MEPNTDTRTLEARTNQAESLLKTWWWEREFAMVFAQDTKEILARVKEETGLEYEIDPEPRSCHRCIPFRLKAESKIELQVHHQTPEEQAEEMILAHYKGREFTAFNPREAEALIARVKDATGVQYEIDMDILHQSGGLPLKPCLPIRSLTANIALAPGSFEGNVNEPEPGEALTRGYFTICESEAQYNTLMGVIQDSGGRLGQYLNDWNDLPVISYNGHKSFLRFDRNMVYKIPEPAKGKSTGKRPARPTVQATEVIPSKYPELDNQYYQVEIGHGLNYRIPAYVILEHYAQRLLGHYGDYGIDWIMNNVVIPLFERNPFLIQDHARAYMNWEDVKEYATFQPFVEPEVDYQKGWVEGSSGFNSNYDL